MSARCLSGIIFMLTLGGIWLGALLRRTLPRHHLNRGDPWEKSSLKMQFLAKQLCSP